MVLTVDNHDGVRFRPPKFSGDRISNDSLDVRFDLWFQRVRSILDPPENLKTNLIRSTHKICKPGLRFGASRRLLRSVRKDKGRARDIKGDVGARDLGARFGEKFLFKRHVNLQSGARSGRGVD